MLEVKVTKQNFNDEVINSDKIVLADFFANWCGPCKMLAPVLSQIAEEQKEVVKVCKIDVDEEQELAGKFNVMSIPTIVIFKNGKVINSSVGFHSKSELESIIKQCNYSI